MNKRELKNTPLPRLALRLGGLFILIVLLIELAVGAFKHKGFDFITDSFENGTWKAYALSRFILAIVYGWVTAYFMKRRVRK